MSGFYLFVCSKDSVLAHPTNKFSDFIVEFDSEIDLEEACGLGWRQLWAFAVTDISIDYLPNQQIKPPERVVLLCDLCVPSYINNTQAAVLRTIASGSEESASLFHPYYIGVNKKKFSSIRFQLKNVNLQALDSAKWKGVAELRCILHFQRI